MGKIRVMIADDIAETREVIARILNLENDKFEVVGEASNGAEVLNRIPLYKPDVVLMDINMPVMNGLEATEIISDSFPNVIVIIMSVQAENEYLKKAMFSGAKEYIIKPINYDVLVETLTATYHKYKDRIQKQAVTAEVERNAKIITFYSSKGGVGKSIVSVNAAIAISRNHHKKTLLVDLDLQYGDLGLMLNLQKEKTILDIVDEHQTESYESIKPFLQKYDDNLDVLLAPTQPEASEFISKEVVEKLFKIFKSKYDYILVDTAVNFEETTLFALDLSDLILMLTTIEISSIKNTKVGLNVMKTLNYDNNKVKVIINSAADKFGISEKEAEEVFKNHLIGVLPEMTKEIRLSVNKGEPICISNPKIPFSKKIVELSAKLL